MSLKEVFILIIILNVGQWNLTNGQLLRYPTEEINNSLCKGGPTKRLPVVPGRGWDNLRNMDRGQVINLKYDNCEVTSDNSFLIPDGATLVPASTSDVELSSEVKEQYSEFKSLTAHSINLNAGGSFWGIKLSGSYSDEYQQTKQHIVDEKSVSSLVHASYKLYSVLIPPTAELDPAFKMLILSAIKLIESNDVLGADYVLQLIVRDYGTHLQTSISAGAIIAKEDFLSIGFTKSIQDNYHTVRVLASASFFEKFNFDASYIQTDYNVKIFDKEYQMNTMHSQIHSIGGTLFKPNMTVDQWIESVVSNPVPIDREGIPLQFVITEFGFPNVSMHTLKKVSLGLTKVIQQYYEYNRHIGCMDPTALNFDYNANLDNKVCVEAPLNYTFGGMYQVCNNERTDVGNLCNIQSLTRLNPVTGGPSCPFNYTPAILKQGSVEISKESCYESCHSSWIFFEDCETICNTMTSRSTYATYWCYPTSQKVIETGVMFGGLYTSKVVNPVTQGHSCPPSFQSFLVLQDLTICWSTDFDGRNFAVPFGGFFSCQYENPLSESLKSLLRNNKGYGEGGGAKACPHGYTTHTAIIDQDCLISYCVQADVYRNHGRIPIVLPPFVNNYTNFQESWNTFKLGTGAAVTNSIQKEQYERFDGVAALVGIIVILLVIVAAIGVIFGWKKYRTQARISAEVGVRNEYAEVGENIEREPLLA